MLKYLTEAKKALPELLMNRELWNGIHIDYEHPHVDRLWTDFLDGTRLNLHKIYPCEPRQAFMHPHPWPSAMEIVEERYLMLVGNDTDSSGGSLEAATLILTPGSCYEMIDPNAYHSVRPLEKPVLSVMVTGAPYDKERSKVLKVPMKEQRRLEVTEREMMFWLFKRHFPKA